MIRRRRPRTTGVDAGPDTLEELFAARFARGDIGSDQYRASVALLAARLNAPRTSTKERTRPWTSKHTQNA